MRESGEYVYLFTVGTAEFRRYGLDDRQARRLLNRWIRLCWDRYRTRKHEEYPGSMADAIDNGWYDFPRAYIRRIWCPTPGIVPCVNWTVIERFDLSDEARSEFDRLYGGGA